MEAISKNQPLLWSLFLAVCPIFGEKGTIFLKTNCEICFKIQTYKSEIFGFRLLIIARIFNDFPHHLIAFMYVNTSFRSQLPIF
jgi:hypothetical protein